jgi:1-deoxy-D-xylulose-5-phosphate synthase
MAPADENECRQMLYTGFTHDGPSAVRYPRGGGPGAAIVQEMEALPLGKAEVRRSGRKIALLAFGSMVTPAMEAAQSLDATVVNMRFIKPLDADTVLRMAATHDVLVTLEENAVLGGAGSAINECLAAQQITVPILNLGLPDRFVAHGKREHLLAECGLTCDGIIAAIRSFTSSGLVKLSQSK